MNESYSSTYNKGGCEAVDYNTYLYAELCSAKDVVVFNKSNEIIQKNFQFRMVRNNEDNIPEYIDSIVEDRYSDDENLLFRINVIPSGGLRGTIYSEILKIS